MQTLNYKYLPLYDGERILDLGCGEGRHALNIYCENRVLSVGADLSADSLAVAAEKKRQLVSGKGRLQLLQTDGCCLPFADNSFDRVVCSEMLEHIPQYQKVLAEISRVLRDGGILCVSVPRYWPERLCWWLSREYRSEPGGHIRIFRGNILRKEIEGLDFKHYKTHYAHALHSPLWWLKCIFWKNRETMWLIRCWHAVLVWDLMKKPALTRWLEAILNPLMGKSIVMYFKKALPVL